LSRPLEAGRGALAPFASLTGPRDAGIRTGVMRSTDIKKLLKAQPFLPLRVGLSDGRSVLIRHPDQVVVAERHLVVGLATIERSGPLATPRSRDAVARDWLIVNLVHIVTLEPADGAAGRAKRHAHP
jgi:hypothetical protein